jgi:hypothetical protein
VAKTRANKKQETIMVAKSATSNRSAQRSETPSPPSSLKKKSSGTSKQSDSDDDDDGDVVVVVDSVRGDNKYSLPSLIKNRTAGISYNGDDDDVEMLELEHDVFRYVDTMLLKSTESLISQNTCTSSFFEPVFSLSRTFTLLPWHMALSSFWFSLLLWFSWLRI